MEPTWSAAETENNVIGFNLTEFNKCENKFQTNYSIQPLLISVGLIFFGLFLCLCGYRAFRFNLWFSGFNFSFWCVLAICNRVENLPNGANWGAAFSVGTLAGCVTHLLPGVGTFLWGVYSGAILTGVILSILVACEVYFPTPIASASLCLLVGGSACGALILTRHWSRDGLILSTALCGGLMVMAGIDYFCERWRLMEFLWHQVLRLAPEPLLKPVPCWYSYIIASMFPLFFILGVITQHMATAKQYKKKVERVYVPPTVVNVYGTIRRTLGRSRDGMSRQIDYRPAGRSSNGAGGRSRSNGQSRSQNARNGRSSGNSRESSRLPSAPNPDSVTSPNLSRAARSRDRARQSGRRMAQNIFNQNQPDQQRLINQTNSNNQQQQQQQSRPNKHQAVNVVDECPPSYDEIFKVVGNRKGNRNSHSQAVPR